MNGASSGLKRVEVPRLLAVLEPSLRQQTVFCRRIANLFVSAKREFVGMVILSINLGDQVDGELSSDFSQHSMRHRFACEADANGASVEAIRLALGHSGLGTTQKYLSRVRRGINEAFAKVNVPKLG